jgi:electron transport complex protein RnfG
MRDAVRLVGVLLAICVVASGLLAVVNAFTNERIEQSLGEEANKLRTEALVGAGKEVKFGEPKKVGSLTCYEGAVDGKPVGTAFTVTAPRGYAGPIEIVVGVDPVGERITGVRIINQNETPGLGARIVQVNPGEDEPWFLRQFKGLAPDRVFIKPKGDVDAITAATVSSNAVTEAVRQGFEEFLKAKKAQRGSQ